MKKGRIAISFLNLLFLSLDVAAIVTPLLKANSKQGNVQSITWNCVRRLEAVTSWRYIQSIGYPRVLNVKNSRCTWKIVTDSKSRIRIAFRGLDLYADDPKHCGSNYIEIIDDTLKQSQARFCGKALPNDIVSQGSKIRIDFQGQPGLATNSKGFRIAYSKTKDTAGFYSFQSFGRQKFYSANQNLKSTTTKTIDSSKKDLEVPLKKRENGLNFWATLAGGLVASVAFISIGFLLWKRRKEIQNFKNQLQEKRRKNTNAASTLSVKQQNLPLGKVNNLSLLGKKTFVKSRINLNNQSAKNGYRIKKNYPQRSNEHCDINYPSTDKTFPNIEDSKYQKNWTLQSLRKEAVSPNDQDKNFKFQNLAKSYSPLMSDDLQPPPLPPKTNIKFKRFESESQRTKKMLSSRRKYNKEINLSDKLFANQNFSRSNLHLNHSKSNSNDSNCHRHSNSAFEFSYEDQNRGTDHFSLRHGYKPTEDIFLQRYKSEQSRSAPEFADAKISSNRCPSNGDRRMNHNVRKSLINHPRTNFKQPELLSLNSLPKNVNFKNKNNSGQSKTNQIHHFDCPPPLPGKQKRLSKSQIE